MIRVAFWMLVGVIGKFAGLVAGIAFASFLSCFAACYFAGFMTRSFALVAEQPGDLWVMDPNTASPDRFANLTASARDRVRSVAGVADATVLALGTADARFPDGRLQPIDVIGLDDATLAGAPMVGDALGAPLLRASDAAILDAGGSVANKLMTHDRAGGGPLRTLRSGGELLIADHRVVVAGLSQGLPRRRQSRFRTEPSVLRGAAGAGADPVVKNEGCWLAERRAIQSVARSAGRPARRYNQRGKGEAATGGGSR